MKRIITRAALAIGLAGALLATRPAAASSVSCYSAKAWGQASCTSNRLPANGKWHFVHLTTGSGGDYNVFDAVNGHLVGAGNGGWAGADRTIYGLYSNYYIKVSAPLIAYGHLDNDD